MLIDDKLFRLELIGFECSDPAESLCKPRLRVENKGKKSTQTIVLNQQIRKVPGHELRCAAIADRAVLVAEATHGHRIIVFRLTEPYPIEEVIRSLEPSVSPSGKAIVYASIPPRFMPQADTLVLNLIDFSGESVRKKVLYPAVNRSSGSPEPWAEDAAYAPLLVSGIVWNADREFAFAEKRGDQSIYDVVQINFSANAAKVTEKRHNLAWRQLVKPECAQFNGKGLLVRNITFERKKSLLVEFNPHECLRSNLLTLNLKAR